MPANNFGVRHKPKHYGLDTMPANNFGVRHKTKRYISLADIETLPESFTAYALGKRLNTDPHVICGWISKKSLPAKKDADGSWRIFYADLLNWLQRTGRLKDELQPVEFSRETF